MSIPLEDALNELDYSFKICSSSITNRILVRSKLPACIFSDEFVLFLSAEDDIPGFEDWGFSRLVAMFPPKYSSSIFSTSI